MTFHTHIYVRAVLYTLAQVYLNIMHNHFEAYSRQHLPYGVSERICGVQGLVLVT